MYTILLESLDKKSLIFTCPATLDNDEKCNQCWDYQLVRSVACLSDNEMQSVEKKMNKISQICSGDFQRCPNCSIVCINIGSIKRTRCGMCSYAFCWFCLSEWNAPFDDYECGNDICTRQDPRLSYLTDHSEMVVMGYTGTETYQTRLCPGCGFIIQPNKGCKHMTSFYIYNHIYFRWIAQIAH